MDAAGRVAVVEARRPPGRPPVRSLLVNGVVQGDDSPLGVVMQGRLGRLPGLLAAVRRAPATAPDRADAHETPAKLLTDLGRLAEALQEIETAPTSELDDPDLALGRKATPHNIAVTEGRRS